MFEYLSTLFSEPLAFFDQAIFPHARRAHRPVLPRMGACLCRLSLRRRYGQARGRLTLNPLRHLDPVGTILMFFVGFGYAKPVPVNPYHFRGDRNRDDFLVSIAGLRSI